MCRRILNTSVLLAAVLVFQLQCDGWCISIHGDVQKEANAQAPSCHKTSDHASTPDSTPDGGEQSDCEHQHGFEAKAPFKPTKLTFVSTLPEASISSELPTLAVWVSTVSQDTSRESVLPSFHLVLRI